MDPTSLDTIIREAEENVNLAETYELDARYLDSRRVISILIVFCLNLILFLVLFVGFSMKLEFLVFSLAVVFGLMASLLSLCYIPLTMEIVAAEDVCESMYECYYEDLHPVRGVGFGFYKFDFSYPARRGMLRLEEQLSAAERKLLSDVNLRMGSPIESYRQARGIESDVATKRTLKSLQCIEEILETTAKFKQRKFIKDYCYLIAEEHCVEMIEGMRGSYLGLCIMIAAFLCGCLGGMLAPRVIALEKKNEEALLLHNAK